MAFHLGNSKYELAASQVSDVADYLFAIVSDTEMELDCLRDGWADLAIKGSDLARVG